MKEEWVRKQTVLWARDEQALERSLYSFASALRLRAGSILDVERREPARGEGELQRTELPGENRSEFQRGERSENESAERSEPKLAERSEHKIAARHVAVIHYEIPLPASALHRRERRFGGS